MCRVALFCQDAPLLQKLRACLEKEGFTVCMHLCQVEAVAVVNSPLTSTQVEVLQAYVEAGGVEEVARLRGCSAETVRRHLAEARRRVGAKNVAQLVHIAWALGLLTIGYNKNWSKNGKNLVLTRGGGRCRIGGRKPKKEEV